ncbi:penicillin-binding protein [Microtetraspora sp. NBRC 13810]|uniref:penicillin-binding transpeptidase domain-containing protein n=1 Tax=Microtetraspora sp. NBRC 13810 TaxID=3030990 RepID=UPI0024A5BFD9|nr:penicillin-binding transpeptidase domain-containing protein [Microtetraspora sp. NBRC 13810]GLW05294.1 penicillin-binding protein [Microtetraspora sp. NBRC 13810]
MTRAVAVPARTRTVAAALALVATAPLLTGCFEEPSANEAVREFLVGWQSGDYEAAATRTDGDPKVVARALGDVRVQLDAASIRFDLKGLKRTGDTSQADFQAEIDLGENNPLWVYQGKLPLHLVGGRWKVRWSPSVLHPQLREGQRFAVETSSEGRKPIVDRDGDSLQGPTRLYIAGVVPANLKGDQKQVCEELAKVTGFAADRLLSRIQSAPPNLFVPLVTFGRKKFGQLESQLRAIRQVQINIEEQPFAPDPPRQIVGRVSEVTPESELQLGGPQRAGDSVGLTGLQKAYQDQLTGATDTRVITLDLRTNAEVAQLAEWPAPTNTLVATTIDARLQQAAELAVRSSRRAALVAVDTDTGEIRAVSTQDMDQEKDALAGKFPAGSAFSVIAADALLKAGVAPRQKVPCPPQRSVGGAQFQQVSALPVKPTTFRGGFAAGCVTAMAALARRISAPALAASATDFGIGSKWQLPLKSFAGEMPKMSSDAAIARAIVGQNVKVSPLSMALVAAAVANGTWHPPTLVTSPDSPDPVAEVTPAPQPNPIRLDSKTVASLRSLMRAGVTSGSARTANASGPAVHGISTGATGPHSWFIGWQGDVAVAVLADRVDPAAIAGSFFHNSNATAAS